MHSRTFLHTVLQATLNTITAKPGPTAMGAAITQATTTTMGAALAIALAAASLADTEEVAAACVPPRCLPPATCSW